MVGELLLRNLVEVHARYPSIPESELLKVQDFWFNILDRGRIPDWDDKNAVALLIKDLVWTYDTLPKLYTTLNSL